MIVRDEATMLPAFFDSVVGLWDELVVVDTGSEDETVSLCEAAGAKMVHFPWIDDFSAARNAGLEVASGEWVLFLDADERPSPKVSEQILATIQTREAGAATVMMRNEFPHGNHRDASLLRLFRAHSSVRFRYPIHEDVSRPVLDRLESTGRKMVHLDGIVRHLGYVRKTMVDRDKKLRDLRMLERCLVAAPDDLYIHFKLLELARFWDDGPLLRRSAGTALESLRRTPAMTLRGLHYGGDLIVSIVLGHFTGDTDGQLDFLNRWMDAVRPSAILRYWRGQVREQLGDRAGAEDDFRGAMAVVDSRDVQMSTVRPRMGLCRLAMAQGDLEAAIAHANHALEVNPRDSEVVTASLALSQIMGGDEAAAALAREHEQLYGASDLIERTLKHLGIR
jgi:glycosyltransferase involved in cell wall biosynthesis